MGENPRQHGPAPAPPDARAAESRVSRQAPANLPRQLLILLIQQPRSPAVSAFVSFPDTPPKEAFSASRLAFQVTCRNSDNQALMEVERGRILRQLSPSFLLPFKLPRLSGTRLNNHHKTP